MYINECGREENRLFLKTARSLFLDNDVSLGFLKCVFWCQVLKAKCHMVPSYTKGRTAKFVDSLKNEKVTPEQFK